MIVAGYRKSQDMESRRTLAIIFNTQMGKPYLVPAIKRAFEVIELLAGSDAGRTVSDIHRELRLPLSSAATILYTLQALGYLDRDRATARYKLGMRMLTFSRLAGDQIDLVGRCHQLLEMMVRDSGLTAHLAVLRDGEAMYVDRVPASGLIQFSSYVGMRWPAHVSGVGKALLAFQPEKYLQETLAAMPLRKVTNRTITSKAVLLKQLRGFRKTGYSWEIGEGELGVACVAAPILGRDRAAIAAISVTGTTNQITKTSIASLGASVKRYAQKMSARLGNAD
jgi:DNA-binding IclR family transcriptional regulator